MMNLKKRRKMMNIESGKIVIFLLILFLLIPQQNLAKSHDLESVDVEWQFRQEDYYILGANMLINGLIGGFGMMNAHDVPLRYFYKSHYFNQGFQQGALGGSINYFGKKCMTFGAEDPRYIGAGKLISDFGTSLTYSATNGDRYLDNPRFITDLGPVILDFEKNNGYRPHLYVWPGSVLGSIHFFAEGGELDTELSLYTLMLVYRNMPTEYTGFNNSFDFEGDWVVGAFSLNNNIFLGEHTNARFLPHESIHTRQHFQGIVWQPILERELLQIDQVKQLNDDYRINDWPIKLVLAPDLCIISLDFLESEILDPTLDNYDNRPREFEVDHLFPDYIQTGDY